MVACFRYASIIVHSVYLPPSKLEFRYDGLDWIQKEADEVQVINFCDAAAVFDKFCTFFFDKLMQLLLQNAYWVIDHV